MFWTTSDGNSIAEHLLAAFYSYVTVSPLISNSSNYENGHKTL